ncbi:unnamed protein product, partial [Effrenium voratum]
RPTRSIYRLPYVLDREVGVFDVSLQFKEAGLHQVFCSVAVRGGLDAMRFAQSGFRGPAARSVEGNVTGRQTGSARWDSLLYPALAGNYTLRARARGKELTLIFANKLRATKFSGQLPEELEVAIGPLSLEANSEQTLQLAWSTKDGDEASVELLWESETIPLEVIPSTYLYHSKTLLLGYPRTIEVLDVPGPVQSFERMEPYENGKVRLRWTPPLEPNGRAITSYRVRHDAGQGGDFIENVEVEVGFQTFSPVIPADITELTVPVTSRWGT